MDLLRLGLERAHTAEAVVLITEVLADYGQGGNCGCIKNFVSQQLSDRRPLEAWVLETAGQMWAARRVEGSGSISNAITIGGQFDRSSPGLVDRAVAAEVVRRPG